MDAFAGDGFIEVEGVLVAVLAAEDNVVAFGQSLARQVVCQLVFAPLKIGLLAEDFGFDDRFLTTIENQNISAARPLGTSMKVSPPSRSMKKLINPSSE